MKYKYNDYELIQALNNITNPVKHYRSDYTEYDYPAIMTALCSKEKHDYLWIIREHGTFLLEKPQTRLFQDQKYFLEWYNAIKFNYPARIEYHISIENGYITISDAVIYG